MDIVDDLQIMIDTKAFDEMTLRRAQKEITQLRGLIGASAIGKSFRELLADEKLRPTIDKALGDAETLPPAPGTTGL